MPQAGRSDLIDIACELRGETDKAIRIYDGARTGWLPKCYAQYDPNDRTCAMPEWLAQEKALI